MKTKLHYGNIACYRRALAFERDQCGSPQVAAGHHAQLGYVEPTGCDI